MTNPTRLPRPNRIPSAITPLQPTRRMSALALAFLALIAFASAAAAPASTDRDAATPAAAGAPPLPTAAQLAKKLAELESASGIEESLKTGLIDQYRRAQSNLEDVANFDAKTAEFARLLTTAPKTTASILKELERSKPEESNGSPKLPASLSPTEISQRLNKVLADATVEETRLSELDKLVDSIADRPAASRERLIAVKQALDQSDEDQKQPAAEGESPDLTQARSWATETRRKALSSEAKMLEQELVSHAAREGLYKAQRDQASNRLEGLRARQRALEEMQSKRRQADAEAAQQASAQAKREAEDKHQLVRKLIQEDAEITDSLTDLAGQLDGFSKELAEVDAERKRIEEDFHGAKQRLEAAGLSKALGQILLDRRNRLPDLRQYRNKIDDREDMIAEATLRQIRYREEDRQLRDLDRYVDGLVAGDPTARAEQIRAEIADALEQRKPLLTQALTVEDDYIRQLGELNYASEQVIQVAQSYDDFLAERLLWVRSAPAVGLDTATALPDGIAWVFFGEGWREVTRALAERIQHSPLFWLGLVAVALLSWKVATLKRGIQSMAEPLRRVRTDRIQLTIQAIGMTLLAALPLPLLFWILGQQLLQAWDATPFTRAFGLALTEVSFGLYYLLAFRMLCIAGGVADRHFRWSSEGLKRIRRNIDWFAIFIIPVTLVTVAIYNHNDPAHTGSLGRLTLVADMIGFAVFYARLLSPSEGVLKRVVAEHPEGWLNRLRHLWFPAIVGSPLALAALALFGYVYTAGILFQSLVYQTWLGLALVVLHQTVVRWLILTRRRLALQAALDRQAARRAQTEGEAGGASDLLPAEEQEPDLAALDEQTRRLINASIFISALVGLWLTWSDVLPAFTLFEQFALWNYAKTVDGTEQLVPVTAADVGLVLLIAFVGIIAARNLPALLEILLLQRSSVSAGARYAIKTLSSYVITAIAFLLVFSTLGLAWSQVQWLVAALGVGIGFGLQEIIANFISGLIILFERPVRVGDIVTIGDTAGVVTNIRIRATTIRNWDKQELLVPNKEFITERLLNWTLTDQQNRVTIPIGIEYGSDTRKALSLLEQVAEQHERVLEDPAPMASFEGFGDNALMIVLRCYLDSLEARNGVITDLHQAIYDTFNAHRIQMAHPQRDVHLSSQSPLNVRLQREASQGLRTGQQLDPT